MVIFRSMLKTFLINTANELVGKVLLTSRPDDFGVHLTLPKHEIIDCGAF